MRHHRNTAATLATRVAGAGHSGGRRRTGDVSDPSARDGRRRCGGDASADGLGSFKRVSGAVANAAPHRRRPSGGSDPPRDGWSDPAPRADCAPGGSLPVPSGWCDFIRGTCTCARLRGAALDDDAAPAAGAWAAQ